MTAPLNSGYAYREQISQHDAGRSVLDHLSRRHRHSSRTEWDTRLEGGEVELRGRRARSDDLLRPGDLLVWHRPPWAEPEAPLHFETLYEDEALIAVSKPSGLPTVPGGGFLDHTLLALVRLRHPEASPMHRLGRGTSGLVLFALTPAARADIQTQWRSAQVDKTYRALISGRPEQIRFRIEQPIGLVPHPILGEIFAAKDGGKPSRSEVEIIEPRGDHALAQITIDTGRPHQIRIHLAAAGHPLLGDPLYLPGGLPHPQSRAVPGDPGYRLHSHRLGLEHPLSRSRLELEAPPPAALRLASER